MAVVGSTPRLTTPNVFGSRTERGKDSVSFWRSQLYSARKQWDDADQDTREHLRSMVSDVELPPLMVQKAGIRDRETLKRLFPQVDQIDMNLGIRYTQKLSSNIGDEQPEIKWTREWTKPWSEWASRWECLVTRYLEHAGAWENNADGSLDVCTDGLTTFWLNFSHNLSSDDLYRATESVDQVIERILQDPDRYEPAPGADHGLLAEVLEARAFDASTKLKDPTAVVSMALQHAADKHYAASASEGKSPYWWRNDRVQLVHERLPYGTHALMDASAVQFRGVRWVARLIRMPVEDARRHPAFHPGIRRDLTADEYVDPTLRQTMKVHWQGVTDRELGELTGLCSIWEIHDLKYKELIYLNNNMDRFLNAGKRNGVSRMRHPFLDESGKPIIPPIGHHPGFFPMDVLAPQKPSRNDEYKKLAIPLLKAGLHLIYALTRTVSHYVNTVKRASSAVYEAHPKLGVTARGAVRNGIDGTIFTRPADVPPGESVVPVAWKPPSEALFRQIGELIQQWCMIQSFPMAELTTTPQADTATQEEIGVMAGDAWMQEVVRKFEISLAVQAHIVAHLLPYFTTKADWAGLIGIEDAERLHALVSNVRFPPTLPMVRYASKRRDSSARRVRQLFDLDERIATFPDPLTQAPHFDRAYLLQEASRALDAGELPRYIPEIAQLKMIMDAKGKALAEAQLQTQDQSGGPPGRSSPSPPKPQGGATSPGGSAAQKRNGSEAGAASRGRRGGRRGRAQGAPTEQAEMSAAQDTGV